MLENLLILITTIVCLFLSRKYVYELFIVIVLVSEFYYIPFGGGVARIYHFLSLFVIISLFKYIPIVFLSRVFWCFCIFLFFNLISSLLSTHPLLSVASLLSVCANVGVALSVCLILVSGKVSMKKLELLILFVTIASVLLGLIQAVAYKAVGIMLSLSLSQDSQISIAYGPGFRTEANTFAKYMNFFILLFLPSIIHRKFSKRTFLLLLLFILGVMLTFTRSAIYGFGVTLFIIYIWYALRGNWKKISKKVVVYSFPVGISFYIFSQIVEQINPYAFHKIQNFFDKHEITEGGSSAFRLMSQNHLITSFLSNIKNMIVGNGWGQVRFFYSDKIYQAGGGELITVLAYGGVLGGIAYLMYFGASAYAAYQAATLEATAKGRQFYEGVMFALLGFFVTGQINGSLIAPEYWLLFGVAMYLSAQINLLRKRKRLVGVTAQRANLK